MKEPKRTRNHLGQPVGLPLDGWTDPPMPSRRPLEGRYCRVEPLDPARHAEDLYGAAAADVEGRIWTYLSYGPPGNFDAAGTQRESLSALTAPFVRRRFASW